MSNPTDLTPRFQVRKLGPEHLDWARAVMSHSMIFHSPLWAQVHPVERRAALAYSMFKHLEYIVKYEIDSGLSYGVFDREYRFKRPQSAQTQGALYWDPEKNPNATAPELLEQMDFPLVSIALALDAANPPDTTRMAGLSEGTPHALEFFQALSSLDTRDPDTWKPKGPGEVMQRMGTDTRADYVGEGLAKKMAHWLMREAADRGFRGIKIECFHDAVDHIWTTPPAPFTAIRVAEIRVDEFVDGDGVVPYPNLAQTISQVYVALK